MKNRQIILFLLFIMVSCFSVSAFAFDPNTDCPAQKIQVGSISGLKLALNNYSSYLKDDKYILCFEMLVDNNGLPIPLQVKSALEIIGVDKTLVIHGLEFGAGNVPPTNTPYTGIFLSITGSNITLHNLTIVNATSAISITGSNVKIEDSNIAAKEKGISITNASNIEIKNTTITGNDTAGSRGIEIENGNNIGLSNNDIIDSYEYGAYIRSGDAINIKESTFDIANPSKAIFRESGNPIIVDMTKVGKKLDETGNYAVRIAGKAPECNGLVNMYRLMQPIVENENDAVSYALSCNISAISEGERLCIQKNNVTTVYQNTDACVEAGACECYGEGECIFSCDNIHESTEINVLLSYTDLQNNTYPLSESKKITELYPIISTGSIPVSLPTSGGAEMGGDTEGGSKEGTTTGSSTDFAGADAGPSSAGPVGGGIGVSAGCSLLIH